MLKKRYLFLIMIVCLFTISTVSAEEISNNETVDNNKLFSMDDVSEELRVSDFENNISNCNMKDNDLLRDSNPYKDEYTGTLNVNDEFLIPYIDANGKELSIRCVVEPNGDISIYQNSNINSVLDGHIPKDLYGMSGGSYLHYEYSPNSMGYKFKDSMELNPDSFNLPPSGSTYGYLKDFFPPEFIRDYLLSLKGVPNPNINKYDSNISYDIDLNVGHRTYGLHTEIDERFIREYEISHRKIKTLINLNILQDKQGVIVEVKISPTYAGQNIKLFLFSQDKQEVNIKTQNSTEYNRNTYINKYPVSFNNSVFNIINNDIVLRAHSVPIYKNYEYTKEYYEGTIDKYGKVTFRVGNVKPGFLYIKAVYDGSDKFTSGNASSLFYVKEYKIMPSVPDVTRKQYNDSKPVVVTLKDTFNKTFAGEKIHIKIGRYEKDFITDENGQASMYIDIDSGEYDVITTWKDWGDNVVKVSSKLTVISPLEYANVIPLTLIGPNHVSGSPGQNLSFKIYVVDSEGNPVEKAQKILIKPYGYLSYTGSHDIFDWYYADEIFWDIFDCSVSTNLTYYISDYDLYTNTYWYGELNVSLNVSKLNPSIQFSTFEGECGKLLNLTIFMEAKNDVRVFGDLELNFNGKKYTSSISNSHTNFLVKLPDVVGTYHAKLKYDPRFHNAPYNPGEFDLIINVKKISPSINVVVNDINVDQSAEIYVNINNKATGSVNINIDGNSYSSNILNGNAHVSVNGLSSGKHNVDISYNGDDKYSSKKISTTFNVNKLTSNLSVDVKDIYVGQKANVIIKTDKTITGNIKIKIGDKTITKPIINGEIKTSVDGLSKGMQKVEVRYEGNSNYSGSSVSTTFNVKTINPNISIENTKINKENDLIINVPQDATGNINVNINNETFTSSIKNGKLIISSDKFVRGDNIIRISYTGDDKYSPKEFSEHINMDLGVKLIVHDLYKYYKDPERFFVKLIDYRGNTLSYENIKITINGNEYIKTTDANGQTSMAINLNSGIYNVTTEYGSIEVNSTIIIKSTVSGDDVTKIFKNGTQYYATFKDSNGNLLKNTDVKFNINGVFYIRNTNNQGIARMNINLIPGTYILTATNPSNGENIATTIKVLPSIVTYDLTKYYKNASKLTFRLLDNQGKPVGAGVSATININGVFYTRSTDANGYVNMNINLNPGTYIATIEYNGLMMSCNVKVLPILSAKDVNMKFKDGSKFEVKLVNGQGRPFTGQKIIFNINGVFYNRTTDASGIARLNINLMAGEYIITSMYSNGAAISNKVTIRS